MDVVTLGMAKMQGDNRWTKQPTPNIATRMFGHRFSTINAAGNSTYQITCELAQQFDAVRLVFANQNATVSDFLSRFAVSVIGSTADLNNSAGTWTQGFIGGMPSAHTAVAPGNSRLAYTVTDWVPITSIPRTDGGTNPLLVVRARITTNAVLSCYGAAGDDLTNWASKTDGTIWVSRDQAVDGVATPTAFTTTTNTSQSPVVGIQYLARGKVITVGAVGDSITGGQGSTFIGDGFVYPAVRGLTVPAGVAIEYSNFGWNGQGTTTYPERALDILDSEVRPDVLVIPSGTPNNEPATITAGGITTIALARARMLAACAERHVVPLVWTWLPVNTSVHAWGASDALRVADNAAVIAQAGRGGLLVADTSTAFSGVTSGGQVQIAAGMTTDNIHPNDTGNAALATVLQPVLKQALGAVRGSRLGSQPRQADWPVYVSATTTINIAKPGIWISNIASPVAASLCAIAPTPRAPGAQFYFIKVADGSGVVTISATAGNTFAYGGANPSTLVLMPGESAIIVSDGAHWQVMLIPAVAPYLRVTGSAAASLTLSRAGELYVFTGTTTTWTLPALASNTGLRFTIKNRGSGVITLQRAGADNIYDTASVTSISIAAGATRTIVNDGTFWLAL